MLIGLAVSWFLYIPSAMGGLYQRVEVKDKGSYMGAGCRSFIKVKDGKNIMACGTYYIIEETGGK